MARSLSALSSLEGLLISSGILIVIDENLGFLMKEAAANILTPAFATVSVMRIFMLCV